MAEKPNIDVRIVSSSSDWTPALDGPFELVDSRVVYLENRRSGLFFDEAPDVTAYLEAVTLVKEVAMSSEESVELIASVITRMETTG
jgi:hypothetical protein